MALLSSNVSNKLNFKILILDFKMERRYYEELCFLNKASLWIDDLGERKTWSELDILQAKRWLRDNDIYSVTDTPKTLYFYTQSGRIAIRKNWDINQYLLEANFRPEIARQIKEEFERVE